MKRKSNNVLPIKKSKKISSNDDEDTTDKDMDLKEDSTAVDESDEMLNASSTESDEDASDIDSNFADESKSVETKSEKITNDILQRYREKQGKQLYIRFPHKIPETLESLEAEVRKIIPVVVKVHKPRQKRSRFCLVDFATTEDRDAALNKLKKSIKKGELKKFVVNIPRTESLDFVKDLAERKIKSIENKKAKMRLKKASKKLSTQKKFTSTVIILNLPKNVSTLEIRELFQDAVDVNLQPGKGKLNHDKCIAAVTFPSTKDATNAFKKKLTFGGKQLILKFDNIEKKKKIGKKNIKSKIVKENIKSKNEQGETKSTTLKSKEKQLKNSSTHGQNESKPKKDKKNATR